jgi:Flp pilus assembly protein TadD/outer membrane protein OmpA-like peptidoglycan-associated protein
LKINTMNKFLTMKKIVLPSMALLVALSSCDSIGKMIKKQDQISYVVAPNPLEMHGDSVTVNITGKFAPKVFYKKAVVKATPVLKWNGGEKALKEQVLLGEKATGSGIKISNSKGGSFSYTDKVPYEAGMKNCELMLKGVASKGSASKDFKDVKIADGTIITPMLVKSDEMGALAQDNFKKSETVSQTASIYYAMNQSTVRANELKSAEMMAFRDFVTKYASDPAIKITSISVSAYASPDGELSKNENLATERAKSGSKAAMAELKKMKDNTVGTTEDFYKTQVTAEDWDGFKTAMEASSIKDKELILRILTQYSDLDQREREIKNLSATYTEVKNDILPKLRRAVLTLNAEKQAKTDAEISSLAASNPDNLNAEELMYAATMTNDVNLKSTLYKKAEEKNPTDWRTANNVGVAALMQNKVSEASAAFERANTASPNNGIVLTNKGAVAAKEGRMADAVALFKQAATPEANYNMGAMYIKRGNYSDAVSALSAKKSVNLAIAQILNGSPESAFATIDGSAEKETALSYYVKAIASARLGRKDDGLASLKTAIEKDGSFKAMAKEDAEFMKWRNEGTFTSMMN